MIYSTGNPIRWRAGLAALAVAGTLVTGACHTRPASVAGPPSAPEGYFKWIEVSPLAIGSYESAATVIDSKLYMFGGFYNSKIQATARVEVYDPATDHWTRKADMPVALTHANAVLDGGTVWFVGGFIGNNPGPATTQVWNYDVATDSWHHGPPLPRSRGGGALVRLGRELHYFGGYRVDRKTNSSDHWVLALDGGTQWTAAAPLPLPRGHISGAVVGGKIYAIGGAFGHDPVPEDAHPVQVYDPKTDTWTSLASLPIPRSHFEPGTFVLNGRIVIVGGRSRPTGRKALVDVTEYDPETNTWIALPPLPDSLLAPAAVSIGERIVVASGSLHGAHDQVRTVRVGFLTGHWELAGALPVPLGRVAGGIIGHRLYAVGAGSPATLVYDLSTGAWGDTARLARRPFPGGDQAAEVWKGRLYLFGGVGPAAGKTQIYDPASNTWSLGPDLPFAAGSSSSAVIDGKFYVAGGALGSTTTNQMARLDPETSTWRTLAPMPGGRQEAASGTDGVRFYIFGGQRPASGGDTVIKGSADVQVYDPTTNRWQTSWETGSTLAPLPEARSGMGRAVYLDGEFYIMGGETGSDTARAAPTVSDRVDIYDPLGNRWRVGAPMPAARSGIFPLSIAGRIYVPGGGIGGGSAESTILDVYNAAGTKP